ncbi:MAG: hypothetical protein ACI9R3_006417 [Verrucomicrobiales bacterium]|jgi:hypothetical protein
MNELALQGYRAGARTSEAEKKQGKANATNAKLIDLCAKVDSFEKQISRLARYSDVLVAIKNTDSVGPFATGIEAQRESETDY